LKDYLRSGVIIFSIGLLLLCSCSDEEKIVIFNRAEVIRLLSNDSSKSWERRMMVIDGQPSDISECDLFTTTRYLSIKDSLLYITSTQSSYCNGNPVLLDSGFWDVLEEGINSDRIDRIAYYSVSGDTTIKQVSEITAIFLTTENNVSGTVIREIFESSLPD